MTPKFKINKGDRLYLSEKYVCNGHWLITRAAAQSHVAPKPLKDLTRFAFGSYPSGIAGGVATGMPDMDAIIPKRDGYALIDRKPTRAVFRSDDLTIESYVYQCGDFEIAIDPIYAPLLGMGSVYAKAAGEPIIILGGDTLGDEFVGVIMPRRIS